MYIGSVYSSLFDSACISLNSTPMHYFFTSLASILLPRFSLPLQNLFPIQFAQANLLAFSRLVANQS